LQRDPGNIAARYYLALAAAQAGDAETAIAGWQKLAAAQQRNFSAATDYWQRLLEVLPSGSDQHHAVEQALAALKGK
jgi:cytochrome c-type biogenesis protein CcmH/NrfG